MVLITTVHAYDLLDSVYATVGVRRYDETTRAASDSVLACTTTFPGTGESDPREWLRDVLVGLLESL